MPTPVKPIPDGYHCVTPYLIVSGADKAIAYYKEIFGFAERMRMPMQDGRIGHAELTLGDSMIMLADESPESGTKSPKSVGGSTISLAIYVQDVDRVINRAVAAGARLERPVEDRFYGDRTGSIEDPFGHKWSVATHIEDVSPDEMMRRAQKAMA